MLHKILRGICARSFTINRLSPHTNISAFLAALVLSATPLFGQTTTWVQQPTATTGALGGFADFSFVVDVRIAFANLGIIAYKAGTPGNVSSRFSIVSRSVSNNITTAGNFTRGEFTVRITNLTEVDVGSYSFDITVNDISVATPRSQAASLSLVAASPPVITRQPASQTISSFTSATLSVQASGNPAPSFQWYKNGAAISERTAQISFFLTVGSDAGVYHVVVSNSQGSVTSETAILNVSSSGAPSILRGPDTQEALPGQPVTFSVELATSVFTPTYQWLRNGSALPGATAATHTATANAQTAGAYSVLVMNSFGSSLSSGATLRVLNPMAPSVSTHPASASVQELQPISLTVVASGVPTPTYQWRKEATIIPGANSATFSIPSATLNDAGNYSVLITNSAGSIISNSATVSVTPRPVRISNLSVRAALTKGQTLIVGLAANEVRQVLFRASGPALANLGVVGAMTDPRIQLYNGTALVFENDDWSPILASTFSAVGAFPFPPNSKDSGFVQNIGGSRSVIVGGSGEGVVLVETYDLGADSSPGRLTNVSARNWVGTGDNILIAGFNISGSGARRLLIRAVGPRLADLGVTSALANPVLTVVSNSGSIVAFNDDWDGSLAPTFATVGAFSLVAGSRDAALVLAASPGSYTAHVRGAGGETGEALVEIYELP